MPPPPQPAEALKPAEVGPRERALRGVRDWIESGQLQAGDALPSEARLTERFGVARGTVRAALRQLEAEGLLQGSQGRARRVAGRKASPYAGGMMSRTVAVLSGVSHPERYLQQGWDTYTQVVATHAIHGRGYHALTIEPTGLDAESLESMAHAPPAGLLVMPGATHTARAQDHAARLQEAGVPVVVASADPAYAGCDRLYADHRAGAAALTRWLFEQGRTRPAAVFPRIERHWVAQRLVGYQDAMRDAGLPRGWASEVPDLGEARDRDTFEHHARIITGYLVDAFGPPSAGAAPSDNTPGFPDALLAVTDRHVPLLAAALRKLGLTPNRDVLLVGYDAVWPDVAEARFEPTGPVATIDKHNDTLGRALADALLDRIEHPHAPPRDQPITPELVTPQPSVG